MYFCIKLIFMKFLIIQTASIGDVILATSMLEKLHICFPDAQIDFLVKEGNQQLFYNHPFLNNIFVWRKKENKYKNLLILILQIRQQEYEYVINIQRFASSGLITTLSGAKNKIGFSKNPFSIFFNKRIKHKILNSSNSPNELERNNRLIEKICDNTIELTKLYPTQHDYAKTSQYKTKQYICIAPTSLWFTKQLPIEKWIELINYIKKDYIIYLLGAENDKVLCNKIVASVETENILNLCGKLTFLESASLMQDARMNFTNDSAPLHIACAVNAPVRAIFCSTVPEFGFAPLTKNSQIIEIDYKLNCRPCGLHGHNKCPKKHFSCGYDIDIKKLTDEL